MACHAALSGGQPAGPGRAPSSCTSSSSLGIVLTHTSLHPLDTSFRQAAGYKFVASPQAFPCFSFSSLFVPCSWTSKRRARCPSLRRRCCPSRASSRKSAWRPRCCRKSTEVRGWTTSQEAAIAQPKVSGCWVGASNPTFGCNKEQCFFLLLLLCVSPCLSISAIREGCSAIRCRGGRGHAYRASHRGKRPARQASCGSSE